MEGIVLLGLMGAGYLLNKEKDNEPVYEGSAPPMGKRTHTNVYDVNNFKESQAIERNMVHAYNQMSKQGGSTIIDSNNLQGRGNLRNTGFTEA